MLRQAGEQQYELTTDTPLEGYSAAPAPLGHSILFQPFARLRFHGLGCGKLSISVWLGAPSTGMQDTTFLERCSTGRTRHG